MFQLTHIAATNFMSFEKVKYDFQQKCYVLRAENKDNEGQASNGGGKTSFTDIIAISLLGYSLTGRNVKDCVNWNSEESSFTVECRLNNSQHNLTVDIKRTVYSNTKGQELILLVNGEVPSTLPTKRGVEGGVDVKTGNKYILESILDISESDLLSYFLISKAHYQPFLSINTDKKLEVISRFSKANVVDKVISKLEMNLEVEKDGVEEYKSQISSTQGYIQALTDSMDDKHRLDWQHNKSKEISDIQREILQLEESLTDKAKTVADHNDKLAKLIGVEVDVKLKQKLQDELSQLDFETPKALKRELERDIVEIENFLAGLITCPNCSHKFNLKSDKEITEADLIPLLEGISLVEDEIVLLQEQQTLIQVQLSSITEIETSNRNKNRESESITRIIKSIESEVNRVKAEIGKKNDKVIQIESRTYEDQVTSIRGSITEKQEVFNQLTNQLNNSLLEIDEMSKWITNFEDFKFYLGNKPIETICSLVNDYLLLSKSDLNLYIEGFKKLRSGELRQALTPVIYRNWNNPQSFHQFSEGEKVRLNLAVDLAFQKLINENSKYGGLNLFVNDECLSNLDSIGVSNAAKAFEDLGKLLILVTHSGSDMIYDNTILIEKKYNKSVVI